MKINKIVALALLACASLTSCLKSEYRVSGWVTFANVVDETHLNGDGNVSYIITENGADTKFTEIESKRIIMNCDLLDANNPQSIKLNAYKPVEVMDCLSSDNLPEGLAEHADSLYIVNRYLMANGDEWYLTLVVNVPKVKDSKTEHELNLVFDSESTSSKINFTLYHNANGDVYTKGMKSEDKDYEIRYISWPVKNLIENILKDNTTPLNIQSAFDLKETDKNETK